jgi:hypothetical protein
VRERRLRAGPAAGSVAAGLTADGLTVEEAHVSGPEGKSLDELVALAGDQYRQFRQTLDAIVGHPDARGDGEEQSSPVPNVERFLGQVAGLPDWADPVNWDREEIVAIWRSIRHRKPPAAD